MMKKTPLKLLIFALISILVLAACGGDDEDDSGNSGDGGDGGDTAEETFERIERDVDGGVLSFDNVSGVWTAGRVDVTAANFAFTLRLGVIEATSLEEAVGSVNTVSGEYKEVEGKQLWSGEAAAALYTVIVEESEGTYLQFSLVRGAGSNEPAPFIALLEPMAVSATYTAGE